MENNKYIDIKKVATAKGLKSTRSIRIELNKPKSKYIAREVTVPGGRSYEILYSTLEPEVQEKIEDEELRCTALVPVKNKQNLTFISESSKLTALARVDIVKALENIRAQYPTKKEADSVFLDLYNSGILLPQVYRFLGGISIGTLHRWVKTFEEYGTSNSLLPQYKFNQQKEYDTVLTNEMKEVFLRFLLHYNRFNVGKEF